MIARHTRWLLAALLTLPLALAPAFAQDGKLKKEELDQLLAPIALYPDDLLTNVLVASTYPLEVVQAARWRKEPANAKLKGDALTKALEAKDWDPSIKSLTLFPDVLQQMSDKLEWTQKLGDAFLAQQDEVMDRVQFLRSKAADAGNLKTNEQQKVTKQSGGDSGGPIYVIEPASPEIVYAPVYEPAVVYGSWWYPDYPPYYWSYPGAAFVRGFFWGAGIAIANNIWGWGNWNWRNHNIDIDVNKWNNINVNRPQITNNKWEHNPVHRGAVPYKNKDVREKFKGGDRQIGDKEFRGKDIDRSKIESKLKDSDHSQIKDKIGDKAGDRDRDAIKDKLGEGGAGEKIKDRAGDGAGAKIKDKAGDRPKGGGDKKVSRDAPRPQAKKPSPGAFDVKKGGDVRKAASRGHSSRVAMSGGGGRPNVSRGGGGGHRGGGGGGGRGGGRRSDVRVKHDIVLLGRFANGMGFYRFAYNGSQKLYVGVMAQEAMKVMPQAVSRDGEGYLRVDYGKLGLTFQTYNRWLDSGARMPMLSPQ